MNSRLRESNRNKLRCLVFAAAIACSLICLSSYGDEKQSNAALAEEHSTKSSQSVPGLEDGAGKIHYSRTVRGEKISVLIEGSREAPEGHSTKTLENDWMDQIDGKLPYGLEWIGDVRSQLKQIKVTWGKNEVAVPKELLSVIFDAPLNPCHVAFKSAGLTITPSSDASAVLIHFGWSNASAGYEITLVVERGGKCFLFPADPHDFKDFQDKYYAQEK